MVALVQPLTPALVSQDGQECCVKQVYGVFTCKYSFILSLCVIQAIYVSVCARFCESNTINDSQDPCNHVYVGLIMWSQMF